jgi:hypothetical protein
MPLPVYDDFIGKCDQCSREYEILKMASLSADRKAINQRIMEIPCDMDDADKLFLLASRVYPEAFEDIEKAIASVKSD